MRSIRAMIDEALRGLWAHFDTLDAHGGRPSIAPEKLVCALRLQALYSVRLERQLVEQIDYNLLFRWFEGPNMDDAIWDVTVFTKNRDRLIAGEVSARLLLAIVEQAQAGGLLSEEHFTVDGTLIQAWASRRSFRKKQDLPSRGTGVRGRKLLRDTHESTTDPEARLDKKSGAAAAVPSYLGHLLTKNRNGLVVQALATQASTTAEREAALAMLDRTGRRIGPVTLGADKSYHEERFIAELRQRRVRPHVAEYTPNPKWTSFLTEAERNDPGLQTSQKKRKLIEKVFGWGKLDRSLRQVKQRGLRRVDWIVRIVATAHSLRKMQKLLQPV